MVSPRKKIKSLIENWLPKRVEVTDSGDFFYIISDNALGDMESITKFSNEKAYRIARAVAEIFFPIDAIADRVSALPFNLVNERGDVVAPKGNIARLLKRPNAFASFQELMYNLVFFEYATGNSYLYAKAPSAYRSADAGNITSLWALMPDRVEVKLKSTRPDFFDVTDEADLIEYYQYYMYERTRIDPRFVVHDRLLPPEDYAYGMKSRSPLCGVERNINNILAVYAARYKVYANNGMAGILSRAPSGDKDGMQQAVNPVTREEIIGDIMNRNGLTGDKRLWTVSAVPLSFIKTLATISELQPFEETREDALQIAGIFGVDKDLIPTKDGTTFTNKQTAERNLYQNVIKGVAAAKAETVSNALRLDALGLRLEPDFSNVEALQEDKKLHAEVLSAYVNAMSGALRDGVITGDEYREQLAKIIEIDASVSVQEVGNINRSAGNGSSGGSSDSGSGGGGDSAAKGGGKGKGEEGDEKGIKDETKTKK